MLRLIYDLESRNQKVERSIKMPKRGRSEESGEEEVDIGPRNRLPNFSTVEDLISALGKAKNIIVLAGAGISVSCGIPDFRSKGGIYKMVTPAPSSSLNCYVEVETQCLSVG